MAIRPKTRALLWGGVAALCVAAFFTPRGFYWRMAAPLFHADHVDHYAKERGFDPLFIMALVRVESSFARSARSPRGAVGLMQIMPETGYDMARRLGLAPDKMDLEDPETNIRLGVYYLSVLRNEFGDDRVALLAAYNAGPKNAREWLKSGPLTVEKIPFPETRALIERVNRTEERLRWVAGRARG
ncbi:MAG: lytic transglycosylase domain-containing protein [Elusimicrobia bacterium]|jgi:soluble lytic murein transglycosylase|nr:lytic transglycosylase domain-containing protein [Elusimicrobiota bacterium]MBK7208437.1 lytic transglycosylase domain-containing protein [Elusimicrobiota bacterium]MBK7545197.1 lytic transglycosylase domain-containing protein [Elusimicrobiota bacterium]MBK7574719.1 lytic transglycosylase domain-containing protein [Elusimicrobiota bacterium]MBK8126863.1 lytic transglycosylase domain-containing protein [Elusimicrobiota bacterium]